MPILRSWSEGNRVYTPVLVFDNSTRIRSWISTKIPQKSLRFSLVRSGLVFQLDGVYLIIELNPDINVSRFI